MTPQRTLLTLLLGVSACTRTGLDATPCDRIDCAGHGYCVGTSEERAFCICEPGYVLVERTRCLSPLAASDATTMQDSDATTLVPSDAAAEGEGKKASDSATTGAVAMEFSTMPGGQYPGYAFSTQPVVRLIDRRGDLVRHNGVATLSVHQGGGTLTGTLIVPIIDGVARYLDVAYSAVESGIVLRVSDGVVEGLSAPFDLSSTATLPGACLGTGAGFATAEGGCKDLVSGLVWSAISTGTFDSSQAMWDSAAGAPADAYDYGRTNDYPETTTATNLDQDPKSYCHELIEAGYRDWRLPTLAEVLSLRTNAGTDRPLSGWDDNAYAADCRSYSLAAGTGAQYCGYRLRLRCVRGLRAAPSQLVVLSAPQVVALNLPVNTPIVVAVREASGHQVNSGGRELRLSATTIGKLSATLSAKTNAFGVASLRGFMLDTVGDTVLTIESDGLNSVTVALRVGPTKHSCKVEDASFVSEGGGCRQIAAGLSWSMVSEVKTTWHEAVWDSTSPPGNSALDANDRGRLNDYDPSLSPGTRDASFINYCHDLVESGFSDWRLPTVAELRDVYALGQGAASHFNFAAEANFWSSSPTSDGDSCQVLNLATGAMTSYSKGDVAWVVCVREWQP